MSIKATLLKFLFLVVFISFFNSKKVNAQKFESNKLINISGDNYDFDILSPFDYPFPGSEAYITWINKKDSVYSVFVKKISPELGAYFVISSDSIKKSNPKIADNKYERGIKIVWQNEVNGYYQIVKCNHNNGKINKPFVIVDSIPNNPQITLSTHRVAWIKDSCLLVKEFYPELGKTYLIDENYCANPSIIRGDTKEVSSIIYERTNTDSSKIYFGEYIENNRKRWDRELICGENSKNPDFGIYGGISFEVVKNQISEIKFSVYYDSKFWRTENKSCTYKNPTVFSYPVPCGSFSNNTPYFLAFDSDSIANNNEIYIRPFIYIDKDSIINISQMEGNDYDPQITYMVEDDKPYVAILWTHDNGTNKEIWISKTIFNPVNTFVDDRVLTKSSTIEAKSSPNPFNSLLKIDYDIKQSQHIDIKIVDSKGLLIKTLVNGFKRTGQYSISWYPLGIEEGIYYCVIQGEEENQTLKLLYNH